MPTQLGSDNFDRTETPLASPWLVCSDEATINLNGSAAVPADLGSDSSYRRSGLSPDADQYSEAALSMSGTVTSTGPGPAARMSGTYSANTLCQYSFYTQPNNIDVYRALGNGASVVFTQLAARTPSPSWSGHVGRIEVTGTNASITIKVFQAGTQLGASIADNPGTGTPLNSGDFGIAYSSTNNAVSFDNWAGGNMATSGTVGGGPETIKVPTDLAGAKIGTKGAAADAIPAMKDTAGAKIGTKGAAADAIPAMKDTAGATLTVFGTASIVIPAMTDQAGGIVGSLALVGGVTDSFVAMKDLSGASIGTAGAAADTINALTATAGGTISIAGYTADAIPAIKEAGGVTLTIQGGASATVPALTDLAVGEVTVAAGVSGGVSDVIPAMTETAGAAIGTDADAVNVISSLTQLAGAQLTLTAGAADSIKAPTDAAGAAIGAQGSATVTIQPMTQAAVGSLEIDGAAVNTFQAISELAGGTLTVGIAANAADFLPAIFGSAGVTIGAIGSMIGPIQAPTTLGGIFANVPEEAPLPQGGAYWPWRYGYTRDDEDDEETRREIHEEIEPEQLADLDDAVESAVQAIRTQPDPAVAVKQAQISYESVLRETRYALRKDLDLARIWRQEIARKLRDDEDHDEEDIIGALALSDWFWE